MPSAKAGPITYEPLVRWIELSRGRVRVAKYGHGSPLLLINGIGAGLETWRPLARWLGDSCRSIFFEVPGSGASPTLRRPLRMPALARLLTELLNALGERQVDVLGYSWGGALAQQLAHDAPDRVRRLVLISTGPGLGGRPPSPLALAVMSSPFGYLPGGYLPWLSPMIYGGDMLRSGRPGRARIELQLAHPVSRLGYALQMYAILGWSSLPWLHKVRQPTLVIGGDDDPLVPVRNARILAHRIPHARLNVVPGGGHLWMLEHPELCAALIAAFLSAPVDNHPLSTK